MTSFEPLGGIQGRFPDRSDHQDAVVLLAQARAEIERLETIISELSSELEGFRSERQEALDVVAACMEGRRERQRKRRIVRRGR